MRLPYRFVTELDVAFSRVLKITTGVPLSHTDPTAMVSTSRGRGHGRGHSLGEDVFQGPAGATDVANIVVTSTKKCWAKFDKPEWAQQASVDTSTNDTATPESIVIPPDEYERYLQFQPSQTTTASTSHASKIGTSAYRTSQDSS